MLLIISLIIVALFIYFLKDSLKKYANIFYIGVAVISIAVFLLEFLSMPLFVKNNILGIFAKGSLGTAMFVAVMYAGALPKGSKLIAPLMKIRGELSITAAILVLCHNFTYGMTYFRMLFTKTSLLSATQLAAAVISLVLIAIMLVLTVTSFPSVRKKMQAKKWKQLQRTAYVFYGLMYVHIMLINIPYARLGLGMYIANVVIYSIVFLGYAAMRISKAISVKAARITDDELLAIHEKRFTRILDIALTNNNDVVILGAFGCGAFENNPGVVAAAAKNVVEKYIHAFRVIEFAVYCSPRDSNNYDVFSSVFGNMKQGHKR
uniref:TIGR02452 family protein n=1 Tax=Lachnospira sp. TaxID=2049031 RepID=UPI0040250033